MSVARLLVLLMIGFPVGAETAWARAGATRACRAELGAARAQSLVRDCLDSDPKTPALCRPDTSCEAMREIIAEACRVQGEDKPVCRDLQDDEDEDDD